MANIQHEDAILKMGMEYFRDSLLKSLEINYTYVDPGPTELVSLTVEKMYQDFTFLTTEGFYIHIEFQSTSDGTLDLRRFHAYEAVMSHKTGKNVRTYVVYTGTLRKTNFKLDCGSYTYKVTPVYMYRRDSSKVFKSVAHKISRNEELIDEDFVNLALTPIMGGTMSKKETILKSLDMLKNYNTESANKATAILYTFADKFLGANDLKDVKEAVYMTRLGQMILDDGIKMGIEQGLERGTKNTRILFSLLLQNNRMDDLKRATEDEEYCQKLKEEFHIEDNE
ncbi:MAG: hypothetical protein LUF92_02705 [Clostridiales bacterium]|nr:hypothetical protein [Clostridiales bacterium]